MIRSNALYVSGCIVLALSLHACNSARPNRSSDSTTPVWLGDVLKRSIREVSTTTGTAKATQTAEVKSEKTGRYHLQINPKTGKLYKLGDIVEAGATVVRLENPMEVSSISVETKKMDVTITEQEWIGQKRLSDSLRAATEKEVLSAEKSYINAKNALENAHEELNKFLVKAPFRGVITKLPYFTPDIEVSSGQMVFEIMDYSSMYLTIELPENVIDRVNVGQRVLVTNYNIKSDTLFGQVSQLSPAINETTRTFSGFITINNSNLKLRPGMFVKGDIITLQKDSVLAVPKEIVKSQRGSRSVYTIERNMAVERGIKLGISDDTYVEIESGLTESDKVVIKGYEWLRNRSQVKIMK
ncbi:MAG: efflux RND transporter periplasmic adaptor subunit [Odoribacteraceae bacterium]|jgi:RND family efflux transporter MFP subunit|nr:efflux RND transporter periplasmic adaptor subunit [Odoribacteraceae bacterium]